MNNRAMKDSGIEWIGEIPENWEVLRTKNHFSVVKRIVGEEVDSFERLALTMNGVVKRSKTDNSGLQPEKFENYQILKPNELVFKLIDLANVKTSRVGISDYEGLVSPAYIVLTNDIEDNRYSYYFFMNMYYQEIFNKMADDGVRSSLSRNDLLNFPFLLPPLHEQQALATYLDNQVSRLDQLIADQQRVIEEWKAYKQSLITETVTKGLNPEVELKDSGIEWIGAIPSHWERHLVKQLFEELKNKNYTLKEKNLLSLSYGKIKRKNIESRTGLLPENFSTYNIIDSGDIVLRLTDLQNDQKSLRVGLATERGLITSAYITLRRKSELNCKYYYYLIHSYDVVKVFYGLGNGVRQGLTFDGFKKMFLISPPSNEQQQIADFLDEKCSKIDQLIEDKQRLIEELKAYKQSLIYECVTGKKEVV